MILASQNMGLDTLIVELCALLAEIWRDIHFPVVASLIKLHKNGMWDSLPTF